MKTRALLAAPIAATILGLALPAVAVAQDDQDCDRARREVARVELRLTNLISEERTAERAALEAAREALRVAQALPQTTPEEREARRAAIDQARSLVELRERELGEDSRRVVDLRAELVRVTEVRDEACDADPTSTPTPTPTTTPAPTTTTTAPPPPVDVDVDNQIDVYPRTAPQTGGGPA